MITNQQLYQNRSQNNLVFMITTKNTLKIDPNHLLYKEKEKLFKLSKTFKLSHIFFLIFLITFISMMIMMIGSIIIDGTDFSNEEMKALLKIILALLVFLIWITIPIIVTLIFSKRPLIYTNLVSNTINLIFMIINILIYIKAEKYELLYILLFILCLYIERIMHIKKYNEFVLQMYNKYNKVNVDEIINISINKNL